MSTALRTLLAVGALVLLASCSVSEVGVGQGGGADAEAAQFELTQFGVGAARLGTDIRDMEDALGEGFSVDRSTGPLYKVRYADEIVFLAFELGDGRVVSSITTTDERFATSQGLKIGLTVGEAAALFGEPTVSLTGSSPPIEQISFSALPSTVVTASSTDGTVGTYDGPPSFLESVEAISYDADAVIVKLQITCSGGDGTGPGSCEYAARQ